MRILLLTNTHTHTRKIIFNYIFISVRSKCASNMLCCVVSSYFSFILITCCVRVTDIENDVFFFQFDLRKTIKKRSVAAIGAAR